MIFDCIKKSIEIYNGENVDYNDRNVFDKSVTWFKSKEGLIFWCILHHSYSVNGICDYILIIKLFNEFGARCFEMTVFDLRDYYVYHFNGITLSDEAVEKIFDEMRTKFKMKRVPSYIIDLFKENDVNDPSLVFSTLSLLCKTNNKLYLFWNIVCSSIVHIDSCDCLLIFKLYEKYGKDVFDYKLEFGYGEYDIVYINGIKTISDANFNMLCEEIDRYTNSYKSQFE